MLELSALDPALVAALGRLLADLRVDDAPKDLAGLAKRYALLKAECGRARLAADLGLKEPELQAFDGALRDVERTRERLRDDDAQTRRNAVIASVRLLSWLETIGQRTPALAVESDVIEALVSEDVGRKQVRAVELIVRSLITESYGDQERLLARLREALSEPVVAKWQAAADPGDVLSGLTFSELAGLFVNKDEFTRYEELYDDTPFLTLLKQRRKTIQSFLEDIRRIRNQLAHNKRITNTQLSLLDLYYEEIVGPVQTAHDEGETRVDPSTYLDVSREELDGWFTGLREDVQAIRDDLGELRADVMGSLGRVEADTAALKASGRGANRKLVGIAVGVVVLLAIGFFLINQGGDTQDEAEAARKSAERTEEVARTTAETTREVADRVEEHAAATREVGEKVDHAAEKVDDAAESMGAATEALEETTEKVVQTLDELRDGFVALTRTGGVIPAAKRPQEHYHNARLYEQRGDYAQALASYRAYFASGNLPFVDPHLRFQSVLKLQSGLAGAREVYYELKQASPDDVPTGFAWNLLLEGEARVKGLEAFLAEHPDFAPAWYALSRDYSVARLGTQSLSDKREEKRLLQRFLELQKDPGFLASYLDQQVAAQQVEDAKERLALLETFDDEVLENPVTITAWKGAKGWTVVLSIPDTVKEILYRIGTEGEFRSTGHQPGIRSHAGLPLPKQSIELANTEKTVIQVKYVDPRDREHGPYDVVFDPAAQLVEAAKSMLDASKNSWVSFGQMGDGTPLIYFSTVLGYRSALAEIRYGLDVDEPDETYPFTPGDVDDPPGIHPDDAVYMPIPEGTRYAVVQLVFRDGSKSEIQRFDR